MTKRKTLHPWLGFAAVNLMILALAAAYFLPPRIQALGALETQRSLQQRRLMILENNLLAYADHLEELQRLQAHGEGPVMIQPPGQTGAVLTEVRHLLETHGLTEQEFMAHEHALHDIQEARITETRVLLVSDGEYGNIEAFLEALAYHTHYFRIQRIQVASPEGDSPITGGPVRLWLNFSIYGF